MNEDSTPEAMAKNREHVRRLLAAADEPGFGGDLRRAILLANVPSLRLAAEIGISVEALEAFRAGEAELSSHAIERLTARLGLHLVPVETGR